MFLDLVANVLFEPMSNDLRDELRFDKFLSVTLMEWFSQLYILLSRLCEVLISECCVSDYSIYPATVIRTTLDVART